nr:si:busm1-18f12.30 [Danio rerio]
MIKWVIFALFFTSHDFVCGEQDSVDQPDRELTSAEGNEVILLCNYKLMSAANAYLYWYKQLPDTSPAFILSEFSIGKGKAEPEFKDRFSAKLDSKLETVPLTIKDVRVSDSAVYYCALQPAQGGAQKIIFGKGTKLTVITETEVKPNIYQVGNSCLATDFTKHNVFNITDSPFLKTSAVRYSGQNYYSSLKFGLDDCEETGVCSSSGGGTDLERDEKVNFLSLGIFWLRILFLKTVVFNVLVTFKAWMS